VQALAKAKTDSTTDVDDPDEPPILSNEKMTSFDPTKEEEVHAEVLQ
jgi:hypothetical protein